MSIAPVSGLVSDPNRAFDSTTTPVNVPSGLAVGDFVLVVITFNNPQTAIGDVNSTGFTSFGAIGTSLQKWCFYKFADSTDVALSGSAGSWTFNCEDGFVIAYAVYAWRGVNASTPFLAGPTIAASTAATIALSSQATSGYWVGTIQIVQNAGALTQPTGPTLLEDGQRTAFDGRAEIYEVPSYTGGTSYAGAQAGGWEWGTVTFILNPAGGGGGPSTDQIPLEPSASTKAPSVFARRLVDTVAPVGALLAAAALTSVAWGASTELPARAKQINSPAVQAIAPIGTGTFRLPALPNQGFAAQDPRAPFAARPAIEPAQYLTQSATLTSIGWLGIDTRTPVLAGARAQDGSAPSGPLKPFLSLSTGFFGSNSVSPVVPAPRAQEAQQPAGPLRQFVSASSGFQTADTKAPAALGPRVQEVAQPANALKPFVSASTGWLRADIPLDLPLIPRTVSEISPIGSLLPGPLTSLGWLGADSARSVLAPRPAQDATQPTGPLAPFVSLSNGWDAPLAARQSVFSVRSEASTPVGRLIQPLTSLGWMGPDTRAPVLPAPRPQDTQAPTGPLKAFISPTLGWLSSELILDQPLIARQVSESSPTGVLLTPQPFGWGLSLEQARPAPIVPRRPEPSAPVGTAFALALPSNGWLATDNPRTPLALGKSAPQDPVGNLLVLPALPSLKWLATENPRTPYAATRAIVVDPVGSSIPLPGQHGPFWFIDQSRTAPARALAPETAAPIGALFATLTSIGWLSPFEAPRAPLVAGRPQAVDPLRGLLFGGAPWSTVDVLPGRAAVARAPESAQPVGSLITAGTLTSAGWQSSEAQRPRLNAPQASQPAQPHIHYPVAFGGAPWSSADAAQARPTVSRGQESTAPVGAAFAQSLAALGWLTTETTAPRLIFPRVSPAEPVGLFMSPPVLPGMGWNYVMELPPRWSFVARPVASEPVGSSFALGFSAAPQRRCSPVFDVSGVGRMSPIWNVSGRPR